MKKTIYLTSFILLFLGCASTPKTLTPTEESYQRLINAKVIECVFTRGVFLVDRSGEFVDDPESNDLPWTITITTDKQSEKATIYQQNSTGPGGGEYERERWDGGLSFIVRWINGGAGAIHISIFDSDETKSKNYKSFISAYYGGGFGDLGTYSIPGECRVIE